MKEIVDIKQESEQLAFQVIHFCDPDQIRPEVILNALVLAFYSVAASNEFLTNQAGGNLITAGARLVGLAHGRQAATLTQPANASIH